MKRLAEFLLGAYSLFIISSSMSKRDVSEREVLNNKYDKVVHEFLEISKKNNYVRDSEVYGREYIQHPDTTVKKGQGDCDDLAALANYMFKKEGLDSEFCVGKLHWFHSKRYHCWVEFEKDNVKYILDGISSKHPLIRKDKISSVNYDPIKDKVAYDLFIKNGVNHYEERTGLKLNVKDYGFK